MRHNLLFTFLLMLLIVYLGSPKSVGGLQENVKVGDDLFLDITPQNYNETQYVIELPGGDNAEFQFELINLETSSASIGYTFQGSEDLELIQSTFTSQRSNEPGTFEGSLDVGEKSVDRYRTPGLCCDCIKVVLLDFNQTMGDVRFQMLYTVLEEGDTCSIIPFPALEILATLLIIVLLNYYLVYYVKKQ